VMGDAMLLVGLVWRVLVGGCTCAHSVLSGGGTYVG
jgi:uncharacterized membrane protein YedE/YeeE